MNNTNTNNNPYGHLLDKYLDAGHLDWKTKQQREKEAKERYGHLLDYAKPDLSVLEHMAKLEDQRIENRRKAAEEAELRELRIQERIESAKRREQERMEANNKFLESLMAKKEAKAQAELDRKRQAQKEAEEQQELNDRVGYLMNINPETAEAYLKALKKGGV